MIKRIVKLGFKPEHIETFKDIFENSKLKIRGFEGCQYLELWQGKEDSSIFFTYSYWDDENALNNYRHSPLFKETWAKTKVLFNKKPEAWSVNSLDVVKNL